MNPVENNSDTIALLESAEAALGLLERQAELARVEARKMELLAAMACARRGSSEPLRTWLISNGSHSALDPVAAPRPTGWDGIRQQSIKRLQNVQTIDIASSLKLRNTRRVRVPPANQLLPEKDLSAVSVLQSDARAAGELERSSTFQNENANTEFRRIKRRWQFRGVVVSMVLHLLLIIGLGIITVSVPIDSSIFELQASESTEVANDSVEVTSELTVEAPSEQYESVSSQSQLDVTSGLAALGATSADMLSDLATISGSSHLPSALATTLGHSPKNLSASFYGASAAGNSFCFLIDGSATLRGSPWEAARAELIRSLQAMSEKQRFYVIFYNNVISKIPDRESGKPAHAAIYATRDNLLQTSRWLQSLRVDTAPAGGNHTAVLEAALELEPDAIFMLTDGEMTPGVQRQVLQMLRDANRISDVTSDEVIRVPIHTIAFHSLQGIEVMKKIAEQNNGQMTFVPKPPDSD